VRVRLPRPLPVAQIDSGERLWRVHGTERDALWFGPEPGAAPRNRFDAPGGEYRICYFGATLGVSIIETLVRGRRHPVISRDALEARSASALTPLAPIRLLQLEGRALHAYGIDVSEVSGPEYTVCRDLALQAWTADPGIDGIQYRSRFDPSTLCFALFDRAEARLRVETPPRWLGDARTVVPALRSYTHLGVI
jgi:hypothetical protein